MTKIFNLPRNTTIFQSSFPSVRGGVFCFYISVISVMTVMPDARHSGISLSMSIMFCVPR